MIIYQADKQQFLRHAFADDIEKVIARHFAGALGHGAGEAEVQSWRHSLLEMAKVLDDDEIPSDAGVAIEYQLPQTSKRIDFVITGEDASARSKVIIVELKQWSESRVSEKDGIVWARRGGRTGEREGPHPCYQAWSYAALLEDFNVAVQEGRMRLQPCAYLHNHPRDGRIDHANYRSHIERAPLFLADERTRLQAFIREHVRLASLFESLVREDSRFDIATPRTMNLVCIRLTPRVVDGKAESPESTNARTKKIEAGEREREEVRPVADAEQGEPPAGGGGADLGDRCSHEVLQGTLGCALHGFQRSDHTPTRTLSGIVSGAQASGPAAASSSAALSEGLARALRRLGGAASGLGRGSIGQRSARPPRCADRRRSPCATER